ncbi:lysyl oxidase family protein [Streptomyces sp. NPDC047315]|uniref:lysyl oxidase family protein n=1 Tax=Streptomyces sp. NPDC047315 TaxID=3155142 RepID=UPI0033EC65D6
MTRHHRARLWRSGLASAAALTVAVGITGASPVSRPAPAQPKLNLIAASDSVVLDRYVGEPGEPSGVYLDLGTYLAVEGPALEFRVTRASYKDPVVARQIIRSGGKTVTKTLPKGLVKDFSGLPDFLQVTLADSAGKVVAAQKEAFCPNNAASRIRPDGPAKAKFPESCPTNPFTLGSVWGIQHGWAANTYASFYGAPLDVPDGQYAATVSVTKKYRDLLGIPHQPKKLKVTVRTPAPTPSGEGARASAAGGHGSHGTGHAGQGSHGGHGGHGAPKSTLGLGRAHLQGYGVDTPAPPALPWALKKQGLKAAASGDGPGRTDGSRIAPPRQPAAQRPTSRASVPANVPKPDLRALPAWDIYISAGPEGETPGRDHLAFSSTTWNAGPSPLVVDGFRQPNKGLMDAYQYFYDAKGKQVGYAPTGTMEWDPREGHVHWHFTDFAAYRLLKADQREVVRSDKEAFCLVNTDAVDYTVKNANWHPFGTDLGSACGEENSMSVRQSLDVGSGDTYAGYLPGQTFDITDVPNGTYWIQIVANPDKRLKETDLTNNTSLRKVVLGGKPGARTVTVPPHELITSR